VAGVLNSEELDPSYTLDFSGVDPSDVSALAGAYSPFDEVKDKGLPHGGASVEDWVLDQRSHTWRGAYQIMFLRDVGTDDNDYPTVIEGVDTVDVMAAVVPTVNSGIGAGTFYSGSAQRIDLATAERKIVDLGASTGELITVPELALDTVAPKIIGWTEVEVEPNDCPTDWATWNLVESELSLAQVMPAASGPGYVDVITGSVTYYEADPYWESEPDVFAISVPEEMGVRASLAWTGSGVDLDFHFHGDDGTYLGAGWEVANVNPESFDTITDYEGLTIGSDELMFLSVLGYYGAAGDHEYIIELEWVGL